MCKSDSTVVFYINSQNFSDELLQNPVSNINKWAFVDDFKDPNINEEYNIFEFVEYVQLMQCSGGTPERDLFKNPYDDSVLDDYDFSPLIEQCDGIIKAGAKPHLKLGSVPLKYTSGAKLAGFGMNQYPPDDYHVYYNYIKAITQALVDTFGLDEVKKWRFGVMTEYENDEWFAAKDETPESSAVEYCKLYDWTVQAVIDVLGEDIFIGAHSMTCTEGLWDEELFIKHVARGTNYANGGKGSKISYLSASFYDTKPGEYTQGKNLVETIAYLRSAAEKYGLYDLVYGIDEGRILYGKSKGNSAADLSARVVGQTWQAAYDARLYKQMFDNKINYFSAWEYLSGGISSSLPFISYHTAQNVAKFEGCKRLDCRQWFDLNLNKQSEIESFAAIDPDSGVIRVMAYNFKNDLDYTTDADMTTNIRMPSGYGKHIKITKYYINDDCNWFDEWTKDRETYNITDDCFTWSPDSPDVDSYTTLSDENARCVFYSMRDSYVQNAVLTPVTETLRVRNGMVRINDVIKANSVVFYEISPID